jgi:hypothetical protein
VHPSRPRVRTRTLILDGATGGRIRGAGGAVWLPCGRNASHSSVRRLTGRNHPSRPSHPSLGHRTAEVRIRSGTTGSIRYPSRAIRVIRDAKPKLCHGRFRPGSPTYPRPRASGAASHKILRRPGPARHQKAGVRPRPGPCLEADPAGRRRRQWPSRRRAGPALCKVLPACGGVGGIGPRCVAAERPPRRPA